MRAQESLGGAGTDRTLSWHLTGAVLAGLAGALIISSAALRGILLGQLGLLEAVILLAALVGGKGGGRPDLAEAGGSEVGALDGALGKAAGVVEGLLG